jgi:hypothetical protein
MYLESRWGLTEGSQSAEICKYIDNPVDLYSNCVVAVCVPLMRQKFGDSKEAAYLLPKYLPTYMLCRYLSTYYLYRYMPYVVTRAC